ncbi:MAG TPA: ORF6N domain-containing protein [Candidatus Aquilonibacter sp.]|nr:ORF6N domain-containing protein [Candidatus Aquilonibacter sp.]
MVSYKTKIAAARRIEEMVFLIRGQRVILDFDLARVYGVTTKRLNEQFRRNVERFPGDFAFQLTKQELANLRSQFATSSLHGGLRYLPIAFTEHGALMLGNILSGKTAMVVSIRVVRAFVWMREQLAANKEFAQKLKELESRISGHDESIQSLFEAIRQLVEPPLPEDRKQIGFMRETAPPYRLKSKKRF